MEAEVLYVWTNRTSSMGLSQETTRTHPKLTGRHNAKPAKEMSQESEGVFTVLADASVTETLVPLVT